MLLIKCIIIELWLLIEYIFLWKRHFHTRFIASLLLNFGTQQVMPLKRRRKMRNGVS